MVCILLTHTDRQITPSSAVFCSEKVFNEYDVSSQNQSNDEQESLCRKRYDIYDDEYVEWLRCNHPEAVPKSLATAVSNTINSNTQSPECIASNASALSTNCGSTSNSTTTLSDILSLPKPKTPRTKRKRSTLKQYASQMMRP